MTHNWKVYLGTLAWVAPVVTALILPTLGVRGIPNSVYVRVVWIAATAMIMLILFSIFRAVDFASKTRAGAEQRPWYEISFFLWLVIFWAFFPPSYFFVEAYSYQSGLLAVPIDPVCPPAGARPFLEINKTYSDLSSKIWAAAGTVLAALLALAKKA